MCPQFTIHCFKGSNGDDLSDLVKYAAGLSPLLNDTDYDGLPDRVECSSWNYSVNMHLNIEKALPGIWVGTYNGTIGIFFTRINNATNYLVMWKDDGVHEGRLQSLRKIKYRR